MYSYDRRASVLLPKITVTNAGIDDPSGDGLKEFFVEFDIDGEWPKGIPDSRLRDEIAEVILKDPRVKAALQKYKGETYEVTIQKPFPLPKKPKDFNNWDLGENNGHLSSSPFADF